MYIATTATKKIAKLQKRIRAVCGGTSASKTVSILLNLISLSQADKKPKLTSVVSESFPHLDRGAIRDFQSIMSEHGYFKDSRWNKTSHTYTFETGSIIEFFSADQPGKVRGPRRDRLFINEANNVPYITFDQLEVRTKENIWLDWNPVNEFWFYSELMGRRDDIDFITLTYLDNEALDQRIVETIERRRQNIGWWKVYGLGQLGEVESRIYRGWEIVDEVPQMARLERYGVDFGYSNDPTSIVAIYKYEGGFVLDEVAYKNLMSNREIAETLKNFTLMLTVCDSSEPKSVDELKTYGINAVGCEKGPDSVRNGVQLVQDQKIMVTKRSVNIIKEYRNYLWETDRDGRMLNVPEHQYSHSMDAIRYGITSILKQKTPKMIASAPIKPYYPELGF